MGERLIGAAVAAGLVAVGLLAMPRVVVAVAAASPQVSGTAPPGEVDLGSLFSGLAQAAPAPGPTLSYGAGGLQPVVPERLLDTRNGVGAAQARVGADGVVELLVTGRGGVPAVGVGAVVLNVTAVGATQRSFVTVWPTGAPRPTASNLNVAPGDTVPNLVVVKVGAGGMVSLFNRFGDVDLLADVAGWFPEGSGLEPVVPARILDTRDGTGAPAQRIGPDGTVHLQVTGQGGVPTTGVGAVVMNVTAVGPTQQSFVTAWPAGSARPTVSNLNVAPGDVIPNLVVVKVGAGGKVSLFNRFGEVDLLADVAGWFPTEGGFEPLVPERILDTRFGNGAPTAQVRGDGVVELQVAGRGGLPTKGVGAVVLNVTAVAPTAASFVTVWPAGVERPLASNLNVVASRTVPNLVIVKVGDGGKVSLFNRFGEVDLVADVAGWFPDGSETTTTLVPGQRTVFGGAGDVVSVDGAADTGATVVLSASADVPTVGGYLVVFPHAAAPNGTSGKAASVTGHSDGTTTVVLEPATLPEMFADIQVDGSFRSGAHTATAAAPARQPILRPAASDGCAGSVSVSIGAPSGEFAFKLRDRYAKLQVQWTPTILAAVPSGSAAGLSCTWHPWWAMPFGAIGPMLLKTDLGITFSASAGVHGTLTATPRITAGFEYVDGSLENLSDVDITGGADLDGGPGTYGSVGVGLDFGVVGAMFDLAGPEISAGPEVTATVDLSNGCVVVESAINVAARLTVEKWWFEWSVGLAELTFGPFELLRRNCGQQAWTGTIQVSLHRDNNQGPTVRRDVSTEQATYTLLPSGSDLRPNGSGTYAARVTGDGDATTYTPKWNGTGWSHCKSFDEVWSLANAVRPGALVLERDAASGGWLYQPRLIYTAHYPPDGRIGGASGSWTGYDCVDGNPPTFTQWDSSTNVSKLGWVEGASVGSGLLNDSDPAPNRLVGSTDWTIARPPTSGSLGGNESAWTYTATYDLTLVEL
ncbi:MAG TPA: hypothetical protein VNQ73_00575 [Ilumatobacter sp.]|nr:hypothetical protein [Ilumatobacter sp.]